MQSFLAWIGIYGTTLENCSTNSKTKRQLQMKILIISDLHGNAEAPSVLPQDYDKLWVLGDLVNYGPNPREIIDFVRSRAALVVRGNHDHAIGFDADPRCSGPYREMAAEMGRFTQSVLTEEEKQYLRSLPLSIVSETHGSQFYLCHATPTDPLFAYCPPESPEWEKEIQTVPPGYLLVGHTHVQFRRGIRDRIIMNPGSVGQPKTGAPHACFAVWTDGRVEFHAAPYPYERTIEKIKRLALSKNTEEGLIATLESGSPPQQINVANQGACSRA